mgnify:CR=1 FL=1
MGRTVKDPNRRQPKPVQKVQLSEKNVGRRIVLVVLFLAIGSGFLVYGFMNFLRGDSGWREISVKAPSQKLVDRHSRKPSSSRMPTT